jgi:hypothetical protein
MNLTGIPTKFTLLWAQNAGATYINLPIPTASQIGTNAGYASLNDGFVPLNATPVAAGGVPPRIQDMNGILNEVTGWQQWQQAGGPIQYDATFQAAVGGYPKWAVIQSAAFPGSVWMSTADANTQNPDVGTAGNPSGSHWVNYFAFQSPSSLTTNGWKKYPDPNSPTGYFIDQWGSISASASGAVSFNFPIAFPNVFLWATASYVFQGAGGAFLGQCNPGSATLSSIPVAAFTAAGAYAAVGVNLLIKGY